jgi:hypothetical protein
MRAAVGVLALMQYHLHPGLRVPDWTTGRTWLLTLGYYKLTRPKIQADDWVWLIDHTAQLGKAKCLLVLGVRLSELPQPGECLCLQDLEPLEVLPVTSSTGHDVADQLKALTSKTGVPRAILRDDGSDLRAGVALFCQDHPETLNLLDIKHKSACVLRKFLEGDERWVEFSRRLGQTRCQIQQTDLAFLIPPSPRAKARYMNVSEGIGWAEKVLRLLHEPPECIHKHSSIERLEQKLGWLREYEQAVTEWSDVMEVVAVVEMFVRRDGIYAAAEQDLELALPQPSSDSPATQVRQELVEHVRKQASGARPGERLPGSTEVVESTFGRFKHLQGEQSHGGLTGLLLGLGALVGRTTVGLVETAMEKCPLKCVWRWCREKLGQSLPSQRREAFTEADKAQ